MMNGPRGEPQPRSGKEGGGMSPLMMALLALLAYKAFKGRGKSVPQGGGTAAKPASAPPAGTASAGKPRASLPGGGLPGGLPGGLGDILGGLLGGKPPSSKPTSAQAGGAKPPTSLNDLIPGGLGGLLGGAAAGSVLSGGLGNLIKELEAQGHGAAAQSWVGRGPNKEIAPDDLEHALGSDTLDELAQHTGMDRDELLSGLSQFLPELVDQLTPHGRVPTEQEAAHLVWG
jgi:uncharacterized protein YidB (DUF937 family)